MRVLLILVDGMRPDSLTNIPQVQDIIKKASYTMEATTVMPSVTLPCHMSLFHSVDPSRHGTTTNIYAPQVRPINGLCEVIRHNNKKNAFFYNWEELRDLTRPQSLIYSYFCNGRDFGYDIANKKIVDEAITFLPENYTDFAFLYMGDTDEVGHRYGWMSDEYMSAVRKSWENIERLINALPEDYTVIITADHGGHERAHGTDMPEDMTIPLFLLGKDFKAGEKLESANIKDIAPTVAKLLGIEADKEWEGRSLI